MTKLRLLIAAMGFALLAALTSSHFSFATLSVPEPGIRMFDGSQVVSAHNQMNNYAFSENLVALGTTAATALQLTNPLNHVGTTASSTGVALPNCYAGAVVMISNAGAQTLAIYGKSGTSDTINATAGSTGTTQATNTSKIYYCPTNGKWASQ